MDYTFKDLNNAHKKAEQVVHYSHLSQDYKENKYSTTHIKLEMNHVEYKNQIFTHTNQQDFLSIKHPIEHYTYFHKEGNKNLLMDVILSMHDDKRIYQISVYNIESFIIEMGGGIFGTYLFFMLLTSFFTPDKMV